MGLSCFKSWKHDNNKGNRDVLASPGSYFFLSNSAGQGDEWLSLNKGEWIPFTGVFGQRLEETVLYERRYGVRLVPLVVEQSVDFLRRRGLQEVDLFLQPGRASLVRQLQDAFDAGERPTIDSTTDVHTVASLLKLYLRLLPEPLVPHRRYHHFLLCGQKMASDRTLALVDLRNLLHELPVANFNLLSFICQFLNEVQTHSRTNKMSAQNLATVFGPNVLRAKAEDPQSIMGGAALVQVLMLELIREHESLFAKVPAPPSVRPPAGSHGSHGGSHGSHGGSHGSHGGSHGSHGGSHASPIALRQPHLHPAPCLRQLSMPLIVERSRDGENSRSAAAKSDSSCSQKKLLGHRYTSSHPENCFYPPPPPSQHHPRLADPGPPPSSTSLQLRDGPEAGPALRSWTDAWPGSGDAGSGFWSSAAAGEDGAAAAPGATSGASSDTQEDSNLSAYDNLDQRTEDATEGRFQTPETGGEEEAQQTRDSLSSWSSCEVLPSDDGGDAAVASPEGSPMKTPPSGNHGDDDDDGVHHDNSPASCSAPSDSPLSTGSSEVFLPSGPPVLQEAEAPPPPAVPPGDAHSLLARLQQQMAQQKAEYQSRIQRLERCNDVLERQVALLRLSLEQQQRSRSVAEIKIRNMERAKVDADHRNDSLQREMQLFFQMYGEIKKRGGGEGGRGGGGGGGSL